MYSFADDGSSINPFLKVDKNDCCVSFGMRVGEVMVVRWENHVLVFTTIKTGKSSRVSITVAEKEEGCGMADDTQMIH